MSKLQCKDECLETSLACENRECRNWIDYDGDLNCTLIAVDSNGPMTLEQISKRLNLSLVRIKQIEEAALIKIKKKNGSLVKELLHE